MNFDNTATDANSLPRLPWSADHGERNVPQHAGKPLETMRRMNDLYDANPLTMPRPEWQALSIRALYDLFVQASEKMSISQAAYDEIEARREARLVPVDLGFRHETAAAGEWHDLKHTLMDRRATTISDLKIQAKVALYHHSWEEGDDSLLRQLAEDILEMGGAQVG